MEDQLEFRGPAIAHLIGHPVVAIIRANHMMATEQVKLLMDICFSKKGDTYDPVMITMTIRQARVKSPQDNLPASIEETVTYFQVPLITLLPINSLAIEKVKVKFVIDIHSHHPSPNDSEHRLFGDLSPSQSESYEMSGSITKYESRDNAEETEPGGGVSVSISTHTLPLPLGVSTIIQAYSKAIHPSDAPPQQKDNQQQ